MNVNRVLIAGRLTRDPELRYIPSGTAVCDLTLAINRKWTSRDGEKREEVAFVDVTCWARTAEMVAEYMKKGRTIFVEGRLVLEKWETKDGDKRSKLKVHAENVTFIGGAGEGGGRGQEENVIPSEESGESPYPF